MTMICATHVNVRSVTHTVTHMCPTVHGPLKLRTVHFGDSTIIYENKISKQNIFPWF
jgi:hypothetical protein